MALAWAEDRALLRSTPSADPGAKTGAKAGPEWPALLPTLRRRQAAAPGLARMRQTSAARCRGSVSGRPSRGEPQLAPGESFGCGEAAVHIGSVLA